MKIYNNLIFKQLSKINICYFKDSIYFDNDVIMRLSDTARFNRYLNCFNADVQDRIIANSNNYFYMEDVSAKQYIYLPVVKLLYYFALKAIENNSPSVKIYNSELLKVFNIEQRTLREYYKRLSLILPGLRYHFFNSIKQEDVIFCYPDFTNKAEYISLCFNPIIYNNLLTAGQETAGLNPLIFDNFKFNSKYDNKAFYIYLAYLFFDRLDFTKLVNCCYENIDQIPQAKLSSKHYKQQIYNPIVEAINKLLFYNLLKIKPNNNFFYKFIFDNGYINADKLFVLVEAIEDIYIHCRKRAFNKNSSIEKEIKEFQKTEDYINYMELFNLLQIS